MAVIQLSIVDGECQSTAVIVAAFVFTERQADGLSDPAAVSILEMRRTEMAGAGYLHGEGDGSHNRSLILPFC